MIRRQTLFSVIALGAVVAWPRAGAQRSNRLRRIGVLNARSAPNELDAAFRDGMRARGYIEGRDLAIETRWGGTSIERAQELAAELVARDVEVIVTATTAAVRGAMRATRSVPIVMAASADPVGSGLVASLARPGGNVTGLTLNSTDTAAKRLQLLRELIPSATRAAVLLEGATVPGAGEQVNLLLIDQLQAAARQIGLSLTVKGIGTAGEIESALQVMQRERAQVLLVQASRLMIDNRSSIVELVAQHRLPAMYEVKGFVEAGGLLSYGPSLEDMYRRAAGYVDKILKGAKPADLPIEQPIKFELFINMRAAKALDITIPPSILLRAERVIE